MENNIEKEMKFDFVYYDYLLFFNYSLPVIATNKQEIDFIYDKINFFVNTEKNIEFRNIAIFSLIEKYIFNNNSPFKVQDYLSTIKKSHMNMEDMVCNSYASVNNLNIFNILLTSPYLSNEKKINFFKNLINNDYYNKYSGYDNKFSLPIFFTETEEDNIFYEPLFHYTILVGDNQKEFDSKKNLRDSIYDFNESKIFSFILFNIEKNKDIDKLNQLVDSSIEFYHSCKYSSTDFAKKFKINNFINELFNSIYTNKFLSNNLNITNKKNSYEIICKIIDETKSKSNKNTFYQTKVNYFCFNELTKITELKNQIPNVIELMSSDYAIKDEKTTKLIFKSLNLSENLYIQTIDNSDKYINQLIVNSVNSDNNKFKSDTSIALYNKFMNFLSVYQNIILNDNIELYDTYLDNIKIIDREKIDLSVKIAFEKNNTEKEFDSKIRFLMWDYINPLVYNKEEPIEWKKERIDNLTCFIKNPFFMLEVFKKNIEGNTLLFDKNKEFLFQQMFDILNIYIKDHHDIKDKTSFKNFKLDYENRNYNILEIEDNVINRNFLKSYILNLFESNILYNLNRDNNTNMFVSFLHFINKSFLHLEEKFPNILSETLDSLNYSNFIKKNIDYIKILIEKNEKFNFFDDSNDKYKFLIKSIIKNITKDFENNISILEISENILDKIKEIKKIQFNF